MLRLLVPLTAVLAALVIVTSALAHAEPAEVSPGIGANVTVPPANIVITMTQDMFIREGANDIDVFDEAGNEVTRIAAVVDRGNRRLITVPMPQDIQPGTYTVKWKTLSAEDGDSDEGEYVFTFDPTKPEDPGREVLVESAQPQTPPASGDNGTSADGPPPAQNVFSGGGGEGMSWILVAAVGVGGLAIGSGTTFLLVQRRT